MLIVLGMLMLYKKELGIVSIEAKISLKEIHVLVGYVFCIQPSVETNMGGYRFQICIVEEYLPW